MLPQGWFPVGTWVFCIMVLLAGCGGDDDSGAGGAGSTAPSAQATADETVPVGVQVTLDGSASDSSSGAPLSYQWTLTEKPPGSAASLTSPASVRATFTPDVAGIYIATLVVFANGVASQSDSVSIVCVTGNVPPRADAGPDRSAAPGRPITLDGSASRDPNNTAVTYSWRIAQQPAGSNPILANPTTAAPTFTADVPGLYIVALTVSDGSLTSPADRVEITVATGNLPPLANAGPDQTVTAGQQVTLNGTGSSDPNGDPLTYNWCLKGRPQGSTATLSGANTAQPTFTPDIAGSYVFCLTVSDGQAGSASDSVVVEVRLPSSVDGVLQAYVKASNTTVPQFRFFGQSVAVDGNTLVIAGEDPSCATGVNGNQTNSDCSGAGAVYVFSRTGETWSQQAYLKASNTGAGDRFGAGVSLSGETLVVGAYGEASCARGIDGDPANNACQDSGAVYVFTRTGSTWSQQAYLKASNNNPNGNHERFGQAVALSGNTLAVGAPFEGICESGNVSCLATGAVYVFTRSDNVWTEEAHFRGSNTVISDTFGSKVALDGNTLAVSSPFEAGCATGINGDQTNNHSCTSAGAVYVFTRAAGVWTQQAYVKASNTSTGDEFGHSLALRDDTLVVGAHLEDSCATGIGGNQSDEGCNAAGAVYVFTRANGLWSQDAYLKSIHAGTPTSRIFGGGLAFDGTTLGVAALDENCARGFNPLPASNDCFASGALYLFTRTATNWAQRAYVKASNTEAFDFFGAAGGGTLNNAIAIDGNTLVVGAPSEDSCATGINGNQNDNGCTGFPPPIESPPPIFGAGAAYVYLLR